MEIKESIKNKANKCSKDFNCLRNEGHVICEIETCINNKVHFIKCKSDLSCNYKTYFGDSYVCTCPVRIEIYTKYSI